MPRLNKNGQNKNQQASGTQYHKEHSSITPDYGGTTKDPIAEKNENLNNNNH